MRGYTTLYLPGCDHASISTQTVVEKMLWKKEQRTRHDLGRQKFVQRALDWKTEYSRPASWHEFQLVVPLANNDVDTMGKSTLCFADLEAPSTGQERHSPWITI